MHEGNRSSEGNLGRSGRAVWVGLGCMEGGAGKRMCLLALAVLDLT